MTTENDIARELLLLAGEVNTTEVKLSALRNRIAELPGVEYVEKEIDDLTKTEERVRIEFAKAVNTLAHLHR